MKIQSISSQNFEAKSFRINKTFLEPSGIFSPSRYDAEFTNPELAEKWFILAQRAKTVKQRAFCFDQMGEYRLIDTKAEKVFDKSFSKWNLFKMKLKDKIRKIEGKINGLFR